MVLLVFKFPPFLDDYGFEKVHVVTLTVQVLVVKVAFEASLQKLYSFHQRPEPQYRILLNDFWMYLDFNGFLTRITDDFSLKKPSLGSIQDELH